MGTNQRYKRVLRKQILFLIVLVFVGGFGVHWYLKHAELAAISRAVFVDSEGKNSAELYLEIANTPAKRAQGLMYRKVLADNHGMIFIHPREEVSSFWMKNTYIPLDMIFVDQNYRVVGVLENVPRLSEERRSVEKPSMYVVELNAGSADKLGVRAGSKLNLKGLVPASK